MINVWSRTEPKYRIRAIVLLGVNFLLFCGLCVFTHWLHSAKPLEFSSASFLGPLSLWGENSVNLRDFLRNPIDVVDVPFHGVVLGLLFAAIVAIPIAVSILYKIKTAIPFIAAVFVFAHLPWMAIALVFSCVLASVRPFRLRFRYGAALVGLLPVAVYLILATRKGGDSLAAVSPEQMPLLLLPWVTGLLAASIMLGIILLIASIVQYRPGAVAPVLALMFVPPTILFQTKVGTDELAYGVLTYEYGPRSSRFVAVRDDEQEIKQLVTTYINNNRLKDIQTFSTGEYIHRICRKYQVDLLRDRHNAVEACDRFLEDYPKSRYVPSVLYLKARILDTRLAKEVLNTDHTRKLYTDFPCKRSEATWKKLHDEHPESPLSIAATVRLAQLQVRNGDIESAIAALESILSKPVTSAPTITRGFLDKTPAEDALGFQPQPYVDEAQELYELIKGNSSDPIYGNAPLQSLASLDPKRTSGYKRELMVLQNRYADSTLYDNLIVLWANAFTKAEDRAATLEKCIAKFPDGDALPHAMYLLANLELQALRGTQDADGKPRKELGLEKLSTLVTQHPNTIWGQRAAERLRLEQPTAIPTTKPEKP